MKTRKAKNFRCVEINDGCYCVYFTLNNKEKFIGYYKGLLSGDEEADEKRLTNSLCDYTEVIKKWNISDVYTIYKVNTYEAYRMDETGIHYMSHEPIDTNYYKHEVLGFKDFRLPKWNDGELVTEDKDTFSFVSINGIKTFKFEE